MRVTTVVLGDLARSPRMQYHAEALARAAADVDVVGYAPGAPVAGADPSRITCHYLSPWPERRMPRALFIPYALLRVLFQTVRLLSLLLVRIRKPDVILVQNPPAVPTLAVALLAARLRGARLVVDWHNFGYSILAVKLGARHPAVRLARVYERVFGQQADGHLCVSHAMKRTLETAWGLRGVSVLHDRPHARFAPLTTEARARVRQNLGVGPRDALVVSATSWTADEDFGLLVEALTACDRQRGDRSAPLLHVVISGRGPLRAPFERELPALRRVRVRTVWLEGDDYPRLLGAADVGLCLHRSSSGVDLPMKVVDMLGAGLPVCALDYGPCLAEQIRHGDNGLLFADAADLTRLLIDLFERFPDDTSALDRLRAGVAAGRGTHWRQEWDSAARGTILA